MGSGRSMAFSWHYLTRHKGLVFEPARPAMRRARRALLGALAYLPVIALAPLPPAGSLVVDAAIAVYFAASKSEVPGLIHQATLTAQHSAAPAHAVE